MDKMKMMLKRSMLLCLCLVLLAGSALANEVLDISMEGNDSIGYDCTLPDGRMIFCGANGKPGNYMDSKARLLCLNPDRTVSWEYIHPAKGRWGCHGVVLMDDATLAVRLSNDPYQTCTEDKIVFFTQDGEPTGREIQLDVTENECTYRRYGMLKHGLMTYCYSDNDAECYTECADWNGNVLFRIDGRGPIQNEGLIEEEDGLVLFGNEIDIMSGAAKIMKIDWQGNTVWENALPFLTEVNRGAMLRSGIKTSDGGYLAVVMERPMDFTNGWWKTALVKFSSAGRVLWVNEESFDRLPVSSFYALEEYNGKYVLQFEDKERFDSLSYPIRYLWFDSDGRESGISEMYICKEDIPRLKKSKKVEVSSDWCMIAMADGLWGEFSCDNASENHEKNMGSVDIVLMKIPEP